MHNEFRIGFDAACTRKKAWNYKTVYFRYGERKEAYQQGESEGACKDFQSLCCEIHIIVLRKKVITLQMVSRNYANSLDTIFLF